MAPLGAAVPAAPQTMAPQCARPMLTGSTMQSRAGIARRQLPVHAEHGRDVCLSLHLPPVDERHANCWMEHPHIQQRVDDVKDENAHAASRGRSVNWRNGAGTQPCHDVGMPHALGSGLSAKGSSGTSASRSSPILAVAWLPDSEGVEQPTASSTNMTRTTATRNAFSMRAVATMGP